MDETPCAAAEAAASSVGLTACPVPVVAAINGVAWAVVALELALLW
ncbi:MAG: hypothetical protein U0263_39245 [Polyangiaceae bacterium]